MRSRASAMVGLSQPLTIRIISIRYIREAKNKLTEHRMLGRDSADGDLFDDFHDIIYSAVCLKTLPMKEKNDNGKIDS